MTATPEALERAFDMGRARAERDEAERCLAIYSHRLAREKPISAWSVLPLGRSVESSLGMVALMSEPPGADIDTYTDNLEMLQTRLASTTAQHELRTQHEQHRIQ